MNVQNNDYHYLEIAYQEACYAAEKDEVPIGAVIVENDVIIGKGHNQKESKNDVTAHAEILAIKEASKTKGDWRLNGCILYTTLEPCPMCFGAILHSRIETVIYGAKDGKWGACETIINLASEGKFNHHTQTIYKKFPKAKIILSTFFKEKRKKNYRHTQY